MHTPTYRETPITVALGRVMFDIVALGEQSTLASWSTASWSTASAVPPDTPPGDDLPDDIPPNPAPKRSDAAALALDAMLAMQQQGRCLNCKGEHRTWQCPEIGDILFAAEPWKDIALGRELCRMRWRRYPAFVALLKSVHASGHLHACAASYQAYIRSHRPDSDLTIAQVIEAWGRIITPTLGQAA